MAELHHGDRKFINGTLGIITFLLGAAVIGGSIRIADILESNKCTNSLLLHCNKGLLVVGVISVVIQIVIAVITLKTQCDIIFFNFFGRALFGLAFGVVLSTLSGIINWQGKNVRTCVGCKNREGKRRLNLKCVSSCSFDCISFPDVVIVFLYGFLSF